MNAWREQYAELVSLTQLFLFKEFRLKDFRQSYPKEHAFFKAWMSPSAASKKIQPATDRLERISQPAIPPKQATKQPPSPDPQPMPPTPLPPSPDPQPTQPRPAPLPPSPDPLPATPPEHPIPPTKPPEIAQRKSSSSKQLPRLALEPLPASPLKAEDYGFKAILKQTFPHHPQCESIPDDSLAKKLMNAWSSEHLIPPVVILSFSDQDKHLTLLKNIAKAITLRLAPARVLSGLKLEKEKQWDSLLNAPCLRLVIASDYGLYLQPTLMAHYKEIPQQAKHFLAHTPLLLLSDLDLYLKEPQLKSLLWRAICNEFAASQPSRSIC